MLNWIIDESSLDVLVLDQDQTELLILGVESGVSVICFHDESLQSSIDWAEPEVKSILFKDEITIKCP